MDENRNRDTRDRCGNRKSLLERLDEMIIKWFRHMEMVDKQIFTEGIYEERCRVPKKGEGKTKMRFSEEAKDHVEDKDVTHSEV